jgi:hypothetical protein
MNKKHLNLLGASYFYLLNYLAAAASDLAFHRCCGRYLLINV